MGWPGSGLLETTLRGSGPGLPPRGDLWKCRPSRRAGFPNKAQARVGSSAGISLLFDTTLIHKEAATGPEDPDTGTAAHTCGKC